MVTSMSALLETAYDFMILSVWPPLLVGAMTAILGVCVMVRERGSPVSWAFWLMTWSVALWLVAIGISYAAQSPTVVLRWVKFEHAGVTFIPSTVFLFTVAAVRQWRAYRWLVSLSFGLSGLFYGTILWTDGFLTGLRRYPWGYYAQYGPFSIPFLIFFFGLMVLSLRLFWQEHRTGASDTAKRRSTALLLAFSIGYLGSIDYLATYGLSIYPCGYLPVFVFLVVAAATIRRYHLVDITPAFAAHHIIETMADALLVLDRDGVVRVANAAAGQLFGRERTTDLVGQPISAMWGYFLPKEQLDALLDTGVLHDCEATLVTREGREVVLSVSASVMRDRAREPMAIVCIARDITRRKRAEEQVQQANVELTQREQALRQALADLQRSHEELQAMQLQLVQVAKMESVGRLAAGVAHEVKNPLATILVGIEHLADQFATQGQDVTMLLNDMNHAVEHADQVIKGLLDFSSTNHLEPTLEDLNRIVEGSLVLVKHELTKAHIRVVKELGGRLPLLKIDRQKMEQVFVNLFLNAIQAMPEGGTLSLKTFLTECGSLRAAPPQPRAPNGFQWQGTAVVAEIADTGTGIPEDKLPNVFDPFFTTKPTGKGTGLGLTVTKKIIELHGGAISLRNRQTGGVQVTLMFNPERGEDNGQETRPPD